MLTLSSSLIFSEIRAAQSLNYYAVFYIVCPFDHLASDISVLSVLLWFTASDYSFGILKLCFRNSLSWNLKPPSIVNKMNNSWLLLLVDYEYFLLLIIFLRPVFQSYSRQEHAHQYLNMISKWGWNGTMGILLPLKNHA
jgi:hypothetical protein